MKGTLLHRCASALAGLVVVAQLALLPPFHAGAAPSVSNCHDSGTGSLRTAIAAATSGDIITFTPGLDCKNGGAGRITLTSGTLTIGVNLTIDGGGATIVVDGGCTVNGTGQCTSGGVTVFAVTSGVTASLSNLTIVKGNGAATNGDGGGIRNSGTLTVTNSTFSGNSGNNGTGTGGGIRNDGTLTVTNSTFSGNSAGSLGGGIFNFGTLNLTNTIVAGNGGGDVSGDAPATDSHNLIGGILLLGPLGNYGGPTLTFPLLPGSPAINAGTATGAPSTDQRGISRLGAVDIGAFESQGFSLSLASGSPQSTPITQPFSNPLAVTVASSHSEPVQGGQITFSAPPSGATAFLSGATATITGGQASVTATANATPGSYFVTATTAGASASLSFSLTNVLALTGISPSSGSITGGSLVSLTGEGLFGTNANTQVLIDGNPLPPEV